jgi:hypothetical protein
MLDAFVEDEDFSLAIDLHPKNVNVNHHHQAYPQPGSVNQHPNTMHPSQQYHNSSSQQHSMNGHQHQHSSQYANSNSNSNSNLNLNGSSHQNGHASGRSDISAPVKSLSKTNISANDFDLTGMDDEYWPSTPTEIPNDYVDLDHHVSSSNTNGVRAQELTHHYTQQHQIIRASIEQDELSRELSAGDQSWHISVPCFEVFSAFLKYANSAIGDTYTLILMRCTPNDFSRFINQIIYLDEVPVNYNEYTDGNNRRLNIPKDCFLAYQHTEGSPTKKPYLVPKNLQKLGILSFVTPNATTNNGRILKYPVFINDDQILNTPNEFRSIEINSGILTHFVTEARVIMKGNLSKQIAELDKLHLSLFADERSLTLFAKVSGESADSTTVSSETDDPDKRLLASVLDKEFEGNYNAPTMDFMNTTLMTQKVIDSHLATFPCITIPMLAIQCKSLICGYHVAQKEGDAEAFKLKVSYQYGYDPMIPEKDPSLKGIPNIVNILFSQQYSREKIGEPMKLVLEENNRRQLLIPVTPQTPIEVSYPSPSWELSPQTIRKWIKDLPNKSLVQWRIPQFTRWSDVSDNGPQSNYPVILDVTELFNPIAPVVAVSNENNPNAAMTDDPVRQIVPPAVSADLNWSVILPFPTSEKTGLDEDAGPTKSANRPDMNRLALIRNRLRETNVTATGIWVGPSVGQRSSSAKSSHQPLAFI